MATNYTQTPSERKELSTIQNLVTGLILQTDFSLTKTESLKTAIFGGYVRDTFNHKLPNDIDVLICNQKYNIIIKKKEYRKLLIEYVKDIIEKFNNYHEKKLIKLKLNKIKYLDTDYLSTLSPIQRQSTIYRVVLNYLYGGSTQGPKSLDINIDFVITYVSPYHFFSQGLFSSDKCISYGMGSVNVYRDDSSKYDTRKNLDILNKWGEETTQRKTYLTIDWICKGNIISHLYDMDADTEEEYEKSVQECNNKKQSSKNKLIASIFKKNMTGWDVANSNIVLMKYRSLTEEQQKSINERVLTPDFKFPFLSKINMNDVVYIIPLNEYMYLQEFYMHACDYYYHDEYDYPFSYTTINIRGNIIPIRTEKWSFELHHTFPKDFREIIDTLFEKHRNTIPEDLWGLILSNIDRFNLPQC